MNITVRLATDKDITYIDHLQRLNAESLSFYPKCVFEREIEAGRILLALVNNAHAGYLYHGALSRDLKIHQACIEYDLRGQAYGAELVKNLESSASICGCNAITLRCGSDIAANGFWQAMGFDCVAITPGGVRRMRDINNWRKNLQPSLFGFDSLTPSSRKQDASTWRNRKSNLGSQFLRGKALADYRSKLEAEAEK